MENSYVKMEVQDLDLIHEAVMCENAGDMLRIFFGVKALRKVVCTGDERTIVHIIKTYPMIARRLIFLLQ